MLDTLETDSGDSSDANKTLIDNVEETNLKAEETQEEQETQEDQEAETDSQEEEELVYEVHGKQVTASELEENYKSGLRRNEFLEKTQAHAETVKTHKAREEELATRLSTFDGMEKELNELLMSEFNSVDMEELRETDTSEYLRIQNAMKVRGTDLQAIIDKRNELQKTIIADEQADLHKARGWDEPGKKEKDEAIYNKFAKDKGFTNADVAVLSRSRIMQALLEAAEFSNLKDSANAKKVKPVAPKTVKASTVKTPKSRPSMAERMFGKTSPT